MQYDSAVLVMYRWLMLILAAIFLLIAATLTALSTKWWPVTPVNGAHFGRTSLEQRTCTSIAEDTRRSLLDSGASAARAAEKSDRAYTICIIGRENEPSTGEAASAANRTDSVDGALSGD